MYSKLNVKKKSFEVEIFKNKISKKFEFQYAPVGTTNYSQLQLQNDQINLISKL